MTKGEDAIIEAKKYYRNDIKCYDAFLHGVEWAEEQIANVWHDASEEPQEYPILCKDEFSNTWLEYSLNDYVDGWAEYVEFHELIQWAYISDLLPKQFGNPKSDK